MAYSSGRPCLHACERLGAQFFYAVFCGLRLLLIRVFLLHNVLGEDPAAQVGKVALCSQVESLAPVAHGHIFLRQFPRLTTTVIQFKAPWDLSYNRVYLSFGFPALTSES